MKTENVNSKTYASANHAYLKPQVCIIKMETNYGVLEKRSIPIDPYTPAEGGGNAKPFEMDDDIWDNDCP